ncbi:hypothetical protein CYMTET_56090 [Cymbomonas tetramitiformis]|uniref:Uncharacterized protein n=1 Tax=Cymbomonas tetramitiformis TaxID=36881 RepID=A0AAE0BBM6_9CHLO|nr:hypothetical protein CYMTET_56090 [Cymbomonas tetramitiformis]
MPDNKRIDTPVNELRDAFACGVPLVTTAMSGAKGIFDPEHRFKMQLKLQRPVRATTAHFVSVDFASSLQRSEAIERHPLSFREVCPEDMHNWFYYQGNYRDAHFYMHPSTEPYTCAAETKYPVSAWSAYYTDDLITKWFAEKPDIVKAMTIWASDRLQSNTICSGANNMLVLELETTLPELLNLGPEWTELAEFATVSVTRPGVMEYAWNAYVRERVVDEYGAESIRTTRHAFALTVDRFNAVDLIAGGASQLPPSATALTYVGYTTGPTSLTDQLETEVQICAAGPANDGDPSYDIANPIDTTATADNIPAISKLNPRAQTLTRPTYRKIYADGSINVPGAYATLRYGERGFASETPSELRFADSPEVSSVRCRLAEYRFLREIQGDASGNGNIGSTTALHAGIDAVLRRRDLYDWRCYALYYVCEIPASLNEVDAELSVPYATTADGLFRSSLEHPSVAKHSIRISRAEVDSETVTKPVNVGMKITALSGNSGETPSTWDKTFRETNPVLEHRVPVTSISNRRIHKPPSVRECAVLAAMAISAPVGKWAVVMMAIDFGIASGTPNDDDNDASGDGDAQTSITVDSELSRAAVAGGRLIPHPTPGIRPPAFVITDPDLENILATFDLITVDSELGNILVTVDLITGIGMNDTAAAARGVNGACPACGRENTWEDIPVTLPTGKTVSCCRACITAAAKDERKCFSATAIVDTLPPVEDSPTSTVMTKTCVICCGEDFNRHTDGGFCGGEEPHFFCSECMVDNMTAFASDATHRTAMVNGNVFEITCPVCPPAAEDAPVQNGFSTEFAVKAVLERFDGVPEANASKFIDAVVTAKMHDVIANNDATVNALVRQQRYDKRRETVLRTVQSICDAAYCPNFPHCKCEIANFDGSRMALQCAGDNSCTANFCGWCFLTFPTKAACREHVRTRDDIIFNIM